MVDSFILDVLSKRPSPHVRAIFNANTERPDYCFYLVSFTFFLMAERGWYLPEEALRTNLWVITIM